MQAPAPARPISIAIVAMGGEGGGVLADWIVDLAEHNGYLGQSTSVPGVAQRTGSTIYYLEIFPAKEARAAGREPVLALMPVPGDVDVVLASELMEAGRAVQRGIVSPERTTLIASTHRVYSIAEKSALGSGIVDAKVLIEAAGKAARRFIGFDMAASARAVGSVANAVLFGALAGSGALPFERAAFEAAVRRAGVAVEPSLVAFGVGFERAAQGAGEAARPRRSPDAPALPASVAPELQALLDRVRAEVSEPVQGTAWLGVLRMIDYQDPGYAGLYLDRLAAVTAVERERGGDWELSGEVARRLAAWMSFEDTIRVADLKIRPERFRRVAEEQGLGAGQLLRIDDYLHPRPQEVLDSLPAGLARAVQRSAVLRRLLAALTGRGRVLRANRLGGFLLLYSLASLRRFRRRTLRFTRESAAIEDWLGQVARQARSDYPAALELAACQRLLKGYGETHERGMERYRRILAALEALPAGGVAAGIRRLREAALADEEGLALERALAELGPRP